ncbi:MAG: methyltransferase domain-containing protein [Amaricoccus sp.]
MGEIEAGVKANYTARSFLDAVLDAVRAAGGDPDALRPEDLVPLDSLHVGGARATSDLVAGLDLAPGMQVLDIGCGIGGPARQIAQRYGVEVTGIDLTADLVAAAEELSRRAGVGGVRFLEASALALPFEDASFDRALLIHVGMNIADKATLFAEAARVLRPGGLFAVYEEMRVGPGDLPFPMPWAGVPEISFVETPHIYQDLAQAAGFLPITQRERGPFGIASVEGQIAAGQTGNMPPDRRANLLAALKAGIIAPVELILRRP